MEREGSSLDNPTGGPSADNEDGTQSDALLDPSAGAAGQDQDRGAVDEAQGATDSKPNPG